MKYVIKIIKRIVFAFFLLYGFNLLYGTFKINIPINLYTVGVTTILGFSGFCGIIFISKFIY